ncbi:RNA polymerase sigma factor [Yoonia sp. GPGPB17]|uniref:RNA polymerase sigma factor n=1 Tax=Yoonia sp. GPGPB17 TaxID=3026147 RepID=UPI0030C4837C
MKGAEKSAAAMGQAIVPHLPMIWRFALSLSRKRDVADDLVQATCVRAIEKHHQFDGTGRLEAWCLTICRSIWLNQVRGQAVRAASAIDTVPEAELRAIIPDQESNIFAAEVLSQVMKLPLAQREVVFLVYVEGFRYSEAAQMLDIPIGTVMSRLAAVRGKLKWMQNESAQAQQKGEA